MARRGNSEGTIAKRSDGRWEARMSLPDGSRKSFYGKTRREVEHRLADARRELDQGLPVIDERQTVERYLESWLEVVEHKIKPSTLRVYKTWVRGHIIPHLGRLSLAKLTPQHVQSFYTAQMKEQLSSSTVRLIHNTFHQALKDAVRLGVVNRNVTEMVQPPRMRRHKLVTLTEEQVRVFLESVSDNRLEALYILALTTGMREGELLALRWADIDLAKGSLRVTASVQNLGGTYIIAETKTASSRRRIALSKIAIEALYRHKVRQDEERFSSKVVWSSDSDLVFPNTLGKLLSPEYLYQRLFPDALQKAGLVRIRFHDLRHTAATLLLARGINPKVVSEMLGHASVSITLNVYAHVTPHMQQAAADMMDDVMGG